jgi:hypothetical protein
MWRIRASGESARLQVQGAGMHPSDEDSVVREEHLKMENSQIRVQSRVVRQLTIDAGRPFDVLRSAYEKAVPRFDHLEAMGVAVSGGGWEGITSLSEATAVHGLVSFFAFDPSPVMCLNGSSRRAVTYLSGNIIRLEPAFQVNPSCLLYVPLRVVIAERDADNSELSLDVPSDLLSAFADETLRTVAQSFDQVLAELFQHLALPVPSQLREQRGVQSP